MALLRRLLVAIALLAAITTGCGESEEEKFDKGYGSLNDQILGVERDVDKAGIGVSAKSNPQIEREYGGIAQRVGDIQQEVGDLEAPSGELARQQEALVAALGDAQDALEGIENAASENDGRAARRASVDLLAASAKLRGARRRLARSTGAKVRG